MRMTKRMSLRLMTALQREVVIKEGWVTGTVMENRKLESASMVIPLWEQMVDEYTQHMACCYDCSCLWLC